MNEHKIEKIMNLANGDAEFRNIKANFVKLERDFLEFVHTLPDEKQDLIYDFVFESNRYDRRILEIACDYINFI